MWDPPHKRWAKRMGTGKADVVGLLCLLTCGVTVQALASEEGVWGEVLTLDCEGRLHFLSNSPAAVSFDLSDASATQLRDRASSRDRIAEASSSAGSASSMLATAAPSGCRSPPRRQP